MTRLRQLIDAISMLPDMEHRPDGRESVLAELDLDAEYKKHRCSFAGVLRGWRVDDFIDEFDQDYEPEMAVEVRRTEVQRRRQIDWLRWRNPAFKVTAVDAKNGSVTIGPATFNLIEDPNCPPDKIYVVGDSAACFSIGMTLEHAEP